MKFNGNVQFEMMAHNDVYFCGAFLIGEIKKFLCSCTNAKVFFCGDELNKNFQQLMKQSSVYSLSANIFSRSFNLQ